METLELERQLLKPQLASELYNRKSLEFRAAQLIDSRQRIEHDSWHEEPEINARTAIFEELTAKGHLSRIEFSEDPDVINNRTLQRLLNGWSDNLPRWEQDRRFVEIVEELTIHEVWLDIEAGRLPADSMVVTISDFPDNAHDNEATKIGYGVINKKGMVRTTSFENGHRVVEQVSRSQSNDQSSRQLFINAGMEINRSDSQGILSNQIIGTRYDFPDGVIDIQRALDNIAGPNIIYGENRNQPNLNVPEYEHLRKVSADRENQADGFIKVLAEYERQLDRHYKTGQISYDEKLIRIDRRRKELVNEICILDPSYAEDARGIATVEHFEQASLAMATGNSEAGISHLQDALAAADSRAGAVCGGTGGNTEATSEAISQAARLFKEAQAERKNWKWKQGVCLVKVCPTRPAKTEVGPCSVCRNCQSIFDKGDNPKSVYKTLGFLDLIFESFREFNAKYNAEQSRKKSLKLAKARTVAR